MTQAPVWCEAYIGIPYVEAGRSRETGLDCWGLLVHVLRAQFQLAVPLYEDKQWQGRAHARELASFITQESSAWTCVWRRTAADQCPPPDLILPGDCLLVRMEGNPVHVGVVAQWPWFLHTEVQHDSCLDRADSLKWGRRIQGVYRFEPDRKTT
jgi:cell wall-associated NlpC family hydrolase